MSWIPSLYERRTRKGFGSLPRAVEVLEARALLANGIAASPVAPIQATPGVALTNVIVATFVITDPSGSPGTKWQARIEWGDGQMTKQVAAVAGAGNTFDFHGTHTYAAAGKFSITVNIAVPGSHLPNSNVVTTPVTVGNPPRARISDFDGDGKTDIAVFDPKSNTYYVIRSSNGSAFSQSFGPPNVVPVAGDFDGDGKTDIAVFDPRANTYYVIRSSNGSAFSQSFGPPNVEPVAGDYDGDGRTDIAVFDPRANTFYIIRSSNGSAFTTSFGPPNVVPVAGDYDGDGKTDIAVFDPKSNTYYVIRSSNGSAFAQSFGPPNVIPVPGDYDGDGKTDIAVFDPRANTFYIIRSSNGSAYTVSFGPPNVVPVVGDFDGDGKTDIAVFDPKTDTFYVIRSSDGSAFTMSFGPPNVIPVSTTDAERFALATGGGSASMAATPSVRAATAGVPVVAPSFAATLIAPSTTSDVTPAAAILGGTAAPKKPNRDHFLSAALEQLLAPSWIDLN